MHRFRLLGLLTLAVLASGVTVQAFAAVEPLNVKPSIVAIVDVQRVLQTADAAKSVQQQLDAQRSKFQTEIAAEEKDLRESEQKLVKLRETAQTNDYVEQEQKLQQRFLSVERHVQARRKALDQAYTDSMNKVRKGIVDIVSEIAKEKGVNLAVVKQQVIWNDGNVDITDEVIKRLDKALPNVQVNVVPEEDVTRESEKAAPSKDKAFKGK